MQNNKAKRKMPILFCKYAVCFFCPVCPTHPLQTRWSSEMPPTSVFRDASHTHTHTHTHTHFFLAFSICPVFLNLDLLYEGAFL